MFFCAMTTILIDIASRENLLPLTFTRPVADLRIGILKISEKWQKYLATAISYKTADYLQGKFPYESSAENLLVNSNILPNPHLIEHIMGLRSGQALYHQDKMIAAKLEQDHLDAFFDGKVGDLEKLIFPGSFTEINYPEDLFKHNHTEIKADFELLTKGRTSAGLSASNQIIGDDIFVEEGVEAEAPTYARNPKTGERLMLQDGQWVPAQ